jgi:hypothetical protein
VPEICRFSGIVIRMFVEAGAMHDRPHFHAYFQEHAAVFTINNSDRLAGYMPGTQQRLVETWVAIHRAELEADWVLLQSGQPPRKIDPLPQ